MRVVNLSPQRITAVELSDREVQFITRALLLDHSYNDENQELYESFERLLTDLGLDELGRDEED